MFFRLGILEQQDPILKKEQFYPRTDLDKISPTKKLLVSLHERQTFQNNLFWK